MQAFHLLSQGDIIILYLHLELVKVLELLPLLRLQFVLLLQPLYSTARRIPTVLQSSSPLAR